MWLPIGFGHADAAVTLRVYAHVLHDDAAGSRTCSCRPWSCVMAVPESSVSKERPRQHKSPGPHEADQGSELRVSVSTRSAPEGIRTPNLLIRSHKRRILLRINAFRLVLPEHGNGNRCCWLESVNAGQA